MQAVSRNVSGPGRLMFLYVACLVLTAAMTAAALVSAGYTLVEPLAVLALAAAGAAAERGNVRLSKTTEQFRAMLRRRTVAHWTAA